MTPPEAALNTAETVLLRRAVQIARSAREHGNHPFGALVADENGEILAEAENTVVTSGDCTGHAETNLVRLVSAKFSRARLARCTLYTSTEPCVMCAGAIHWSGIQRIVFALSESALYAMAGDDDQQLRMPCRELFARRRSPVIALGPALHEEARAVHAGFWSPVRA
jgi:tRNA(Arg) A34 adenosine deaminase TadA